MPTRSGLVRAAQLIVLMASFIGQAAANLPFTTSYPLQCTTLNVTFTPQANNFPYNVYIMSVGAMGTLRLRVLPLVI